MSDHVQDLEIPAKEECEKLVKEFASITNTNEALAQFYLQDRHWNLEPKGFSQNSVSDYFRAVDENGARAGSSSPEELQQEPPARISNTNQARVNQKVNLENQNFFPGELTTVPPSHLKIMTWNLDGLDEHNLKKRTKAVIKMVELERPDVIFFQELIPDTYSYLETNLPTYQPFSSQNEGQDYFCATFLSIFTTYHVDKDSPKIFDYPGTRMGRNLLVVKARIANVHFTLFNTHLESTAEFAAERVNQLRLCFQKLCQVEERESAIFGGDLNLRDKELDQIGGIPPGVDDLWVICGQRKECQYTWDMTRNTNKELPGRFKPRCRFDRLYVRHAHPRCLIPRHFGLTGLQKIAGTQSFPSDHWGIVVDFDIEFPA